MHVSIGLDVHNASLNHRQLRYNSQVALDAASRARDTYLLTTNEYTFGECRHCRPFQRHSLEDKHRMHRDHSSFHIPSV
jgi:hypothetical protein